MTFAEEILEYAGSEPIEAISIGPRRGYDYDDTGPDHDLGSGPVSWEAAFPVLNYKYDRGYGSQDCHNIWAWTVTRIILIHEYDGSTCIRFVSRNPSPIVLED